MSASLYSDSDYYVYTLRNRQTGEVFYVGRSHTINGAYRRYKDHLAALRRGANLPVHWKIMDIFLKDQDVEFETWARGLDREKSLELERRMIRVLGYDKLANVKPASVRAQEARPFTIWVKWIKSGAIRGFRSSAEIHKIVGVHHTPVDRFLRGERRSSLFTANAEGFPEVQLSTKPLEVNEIPIPKARTNLRLNTISNISQEFS